VSGPEHAIRDSAIWACGPHKQCYTDITAHLSELGRSAAHVHIDAAARASGSHVLLGAGLVPGISTVMAAVVAGTLGGDKSGT
jgi:saccharopine dehydrogenase-like NADP-dependent oxidoreductase